MVLHPSLNFLYFLQVKDTMRLLGVIKSFPMLISRIGVGGAASGWVIKEFTAQMHAVSKIALHRRANMATFLETHGTFNPIYLHVNNLIHVRPMWNL